MQLWAAVHEAGHWVVAQLLGAQPEKVILDGDRYAVRHAIVPGMILKITAAGFAAEKLILGDYDKGNGSEQDVERIISLGATVDEAVDASAKLLNPYKPVVQSVALAIEAAANRGQQEITAEELRPFYELALQTVK